MTNPMCPKCGSENITSEKRPDGDSRCQDCKHQDKLTAFYVKEPVERGIVNTVSITLKDVKEPIKRGVVNTVSMTLKDVNGNILQTGNVQVKDIEMLSQLYGKSAILIMYEELMSSDAIERGC